MENIVDLNNYKLTPVIKIGASYYYTTINGETYYIKDTDNIHKELVISEFCNLLNIPCVNYKLAIRNNKKYLISKSFRKEECQYITGKDLIEDFIYNLKKKDLKGLRLNKINEDCLNNLETIWLSLAERYHGTSKYDDIRNVMISLLNQYFLMILIQDSDFHWLNWEIEESKDHIALVPKYDNEQAFGWELCGVSMGVDPIDPFRKTTDSIGYFFDITANEDKELFISLYNMATPDIFIKAINNVKEKYNLDRIDLEKRMIERYQEQYDRLGKLIKEKGLRR